MKVIEGNNILVHAVTFFLSPDVNNDSVITIVVKIKQLYNKVGVE